MIISPLMQQFLDLQSKIKELEEFKNKFEVMFGENKLNTISGMGWGGFYLVGDEKSVKELRRIQHAASQLEEYRKAFEDRALLTTNELNKLNHKISCIKNILKED